MNEFTVMIELVGCNINDEKYVRLDELMEAEGFERRGHPMAGRLHPANFTEHPSNPPHATYFGRINQHASALRHQLESKIKTSIHSEFAVTVIQAAAAMR